MSDAIKSLLGGGDKSIEDLNAGWGTRPHQRRTFGTPERTVFIEAIRRLDRGLREQQVKLDLRAAREGWTHPAPRVVIDGLDEFIESLTESWSSERGWDTDAYIRALAAAKGAAPGFRPPFQLPPEEGRP